MFFVRAKMRRDGNSVGGSSQPPCYSNLDPCLPGLSVWALRQLIPVADSGLLEAGSYSVSIDKLCYIWTMMNRTTAPNPSAAKSGSPAIGSNRMCSTTYINQTSLNTESRPPPGKEVLVKPSHCPSHLKLELGRDGSRSGVYRLHQVAFPQGRLRGSPASECCRGFDIYRQFHQQRVSVN